MRQSNTDITGLIAAGERIKRDAPQVLGAIDEVGMREFLEVDEEIRGCKALRRQVAVRVELGANEHIRSDDIAHAGEEIALGILVAVGDHGAVQTKHDSIDRKCCAQLVEDLVAQALIGQAIDEAGRVCPGGRSLDQFETPLRGEPAADGDRRRAERRRFGMFARRCVERGLEGSAIDADRREGVCFGRQGGGKYAQCHCLVLAAQASLIGLGR